MNAQPANPARGASFVYSPALGSYELSAEHPFKPLRLELTRTLLRACGLLGDGDEVTPEPFAEGQLLELHAPDYVAAVKAVSRGEPVPEAVRYGLGTPDNPIYLGMHEAVMAVCGGSLTALRSVASGRVTRAASFAGGLHHAARSAMSGFCTYNDAALVLREAAATYGLRALYIDLDAHHGDGVQDFFFASGEVMTVSVHESGRHLFPGTGFTYEVGQGAGRGLSVNLPLEPFTEDASYLAELSTLLPRAAAVFQPDLIVLQAGGDMHRYDPLSHLNLSVQGIVQSYELVSNLADRFCGGRLVALGGGGYDPYRTVPRLWATLWAILSRQARPETVPESWREHWRHLGVTLPATFADDLAAWPVAPRQLEITNLNRLSGQKLLATLEPIWQERLG